MCGNVRNYAALCLVMFSFAHAQDSDFSAQLSELQQANVNLNTEVSNLNYHYQQAVADKTTLSASLVDVTSRAELAESNTASWEAAYRALETGKQEAEARITTLEAQAAADFQLVASLTQQLANAQAQASSESQLVASLTQQLADAQAQASAESQLVASLRQQLATAQEAPIKPAATQSQPDWISSATATATIILAEIQTGNFTTLAGVTLRTQDTIATHANAVFVTVRTFIAQQAETYLPEAKAQTLALVAQGQAWLKSNIGSLPAFKAVEAQYVALEVEVKRQLLAAFTKVPALQGLTDPVSVQLVTYAIFSMLAMLLLLPVMIMLCRPKRSSGQISPKGGNSKGKGKGKGKTSSNSSQRV